MKYFIYSYQPIKGIESMSMLSFEPVCFDSEEEASRYCDLFSILHHNFYSVMDEETFFENFGNLTLNEIQVCDSEQTYESYLQ